MMKKVIATDQAPKAIGPYSQAVQAGPILMVSGQLPIDPASGQMAEGIKAQTRRSLCNIKAILASQGLAMSDIIRTGVFLKNMEDFSAMNAVYGEFFDGDYPARAAVEVARLPKDALVEIEAVVAVKDM